MSTPSTVKPQSASSLIAAREGAARGTLFAGLAVIGFANGIVNRAIGAFAENPIHALAGGFGISAVAWIALGAAAFSRGPAG